MTRATRKALWIVLAGTFLLLLITVGLAWLLSAIPDTRLPADAAPKIARAPVRNVVPSEAELPWRQDIASPRPVSVAIASYPWTRDPARRNPQVTVPLAQTPWDTPATAPSGTKKIGKSR